MSCNKTMKELKIDFSKTNEEVEKQLLDAGVDISTMEIVAIDGFSKKEDMQPMKIEGVIFTENFKTDDMEG
jgi:hypothetical protein